MVIQSWLGPNRKCFKSYTLDDWAVISINESFYQAPELHRKILVGTRRSDGKKLRTSYIVEANGREITTFSGSRVTLGEVSPDYVSFLKAIGEELDEKNPIRMKG